VTPTASSVAAAYHRSVAEIEIGIVVALIVVALVIAIVRRDPDHPVPAARATVGIVGGAIGALLILTNVTDLIPDALEAAIRPAGAIVLTTGLLLLTAWKLAS
jgi:hypothetical protein